MPSPAYCMAQAFCKLQPLFFSSLPAQTPCLIQAETLTVCEEASQSHMPILQTRKSGSGNIK